ncbi:hypothetical protein CALCODRAFT_412994, partial [Calocera cornea HHB12733]
MRVSDTDMLTLLLNYHIDTTRYSLGVKKLRAMRTSLGLIRSRSAPHTMESIRPAVQRLREVYPKIGVLDMLMHLHAEGFEVKRLVEEYYMKTYEADLLRERKANRLKRKRFWSAGVGDLWCIDQHDKWGRFELWLHTAVEPFSGRILWIRVWKGNRNPALICTYYLKCVEELGVMPLVTQSDLGKENYGIAKAHTALHHYHDPNLVGTIQHRWMRNRKNIKPEIAWSQLRRRFTPGFEDLLEHGVAQGWYNALDPTHRYVFWWVFVPFLQAELDKWRDRHNNNRKRADRTKILPHGAPNLIFQCPEYFGEAQFHVQVEANALSEVQRLYTPSEDSMLELVPAELQPVFDAAFEELGEPSIDHQTVWTVY